MPKRRSLGALVVACAIGLLACAPSHQAPEPEHDHAPPLRVGVAPQSPPLVFMQGGRVAGAEIEMATALGAALGRPVTFRALEWGQLIPALLNHKIDIIMSGMTVTRARQFRIAFADPYLKEGLVAVMRRADVKRYDTEARVLAAPGPIGAVEGTTGERFIRERMPNAIVSLFPTAAAAIGELQQNRIDILITDLPIAGWYVSGNEADLGLLLKFLTNDALAWAMRPNDEALRSAANETLAHWKSDGTLSAILRRWLRIWPTPL